MPLPHYSAVTGLNLAFFLIASSPSLAQPNDPVQVDGQAMIRAIDSDDVTNVQILLNRAVVSPDGYDLPSGQFVSFLSEAINHRSLHVLPVLLNAGAQTLSPPVCPNTLSENLSALIEDGYSFGQAVFTEDAGILKMLFDHHVGDLANQQFGYGSCGATKRPVSFDAIQVWSQRAGNTIVATFPDDGAALMHLLADNHLNWNTKDSNGDNALHYVTPYPHAGYNLSDADFLKLIQTLKGLGADINATDNAGNHPIDKIRQAYSVYPQVDCPASTIPEAKFQAREQAYRSLGSVAPRAAPVKYCSVGNGACTAC